MPSLLTTYLLFGRFMWAYYYDDVDSGQFDLMSNVPNAFSKAATCLAVADFLPLTVFASICCKACCANF